MKDNTKPNRRTYYGKDNTQNIDPNNLQTILTNMTTNTNLSDSTMMSMLQKILTKMNSLEQKVNGTPNYGSTTNNTK